MRPCPLGVSGWAPWGLGEEPWPGGVCGGFPEACSTPPPMQQQLGSAGKDMLGARVRGAGFALQVAEYCFGSRKGHQGRVGMKHKPEPYPVCTSGVIK